MNIQLQKIGEKLKSKKKDEIHFMSICFSNEAYKDVKQDGGRKGSKIVLNAKQQKKKKWNLIKRKIQHELSLMLAHFESLRIYWQPKRREKKLKRQQNETSKYKKWKWRKKHLQEISCRWKLIYLCRRPHYIYRKLSRNQEKIRLSTSVLASLLLQNNHRNSHSE